MRKIIVFLIIVVLMSPIMAGCASKPYVVKSRAVERIRQDRAENRFTNRNEIEFCHAIEWGNTNGMRKLLDDGLNINTQGKPEGMTFIIWAYLKKNKTSYQYLLEHGADPNIILNNEEMRETSKMNFKYSALSLAAHDAEDPFWLSLALQHGGDPNGIIDEVYVIFKAINFDSLTNVQLLIEAGADVDGNYKVKKLGLTAFESSLISCRYDIAYYLLEKGANPYLIEREGLNRLINSTVVSFHDDYYEQIELRKKVIKVLEEKGIKLDITTDERGIRIDDGVK